MTAPKGSTFSAAYKPSLYEEKIDKDANWHQRLRKLERVFGRRTGNIGCVQLFVAHRRILDNAAGTQFAGPSECETKIRPMQMGQLKDSWSL